MRPGLIIFDCDGVLIDSEIVACRIDAETLTEIGYQISVQEVVKRFAGVSSADMRVTIESEWGRPLPPDYDSIVTGRLETAFRSELTEIRGIHQALGAIEVPVCVASNSGHSKLKAGLEITGLYDRFSPNIFSAVDVPRGKPAPDLFLRASEIMNVPADKCLVVEDSVSGIRAARSAGMVVLGFCGGQHCGKEHAHRLMEEGAMAVFSDMTRLPKLIAEAVSA